MQYWSKICGFSESGCYIQMHFSTTVHFLSHLVGLAQVAKNNQKFHQQVLSKRHSVKTFSIRKQFFHILDIELEVTVSEIE